MEGLARIGRCNFSNEVSGEARVNLPLELSLPAGTNYIIFTLLNSLYNTGRAILSRKTRRSYPILILIRRIIVLVIIKLFLTFLCAFDHRHNQ